MAAPSGSKTGLLFIVSIVLGISAAGLSVLYLKTQRDAIVASLAGERESLVTVVVPKQDLQKGQKISKGMFAGRQIPSNFAHANAVTPGNFDNYIGRFLVENISRGKPLLTNFLDESYPIDFSDLVTKGRRAITVQVDEPTSIAGMMRPGNRIDLYVNIGTRTVGYEGGAGGGTSGLLSAVAGGGNIQQAALQAVGGLTRNKPKAVILPVLQDVMVLATGREAYDDNLDAIGQPQRRKGLNFTSVTLDVTPEQAALLTLADDKGDLIGILRNRHDRGGADFTGVTPLDLFSNAIEMKKAAALRKAAAAAGATIDENGNWVTADGKVIKKEDIVISANGTVTTKGGTLLGAKGISVNENGEYVDANGKVIPPGDLIVNADGTVTTKDELMKAAGYTVNENGDYVDANGNIVKKEDVIINPDGTVTSKDLLMQAAGYTKNENGDYVDANGNIVKKEDVIINPDGTVTNKDEIMRAAGYTKNANGDYVDADGNIVKAEDIKILANGTVMTADGKILSGPKVTVNEHGFIIAEDGTVMTADGKVLTGVTVDANGNVIGADGKIMTDANLTVAADGTVRDSSGNIISGITGSSLPPRRAASGKTASSRIPGIVALTLGGSSEGGVAATNVLIVQPVAAQLPSAIVEQTEGQ